MSKWKIHEKWEAKLGIPKEISAYMQRAIDSKGPTDKIIIMPEDFAQHCLEEKIPIVRHKNMAIVQLATNLHDRARNKVIQSEDLKFLADKGDDYVKAYYMHFMLDYLVKMHEWMQESGDSPADCIEKYLKNKAVVDPETDPLLRSVADFLKANSQELKGDYNLK